jgi:uncharacterized damage-inducible protein DinB
MIRTGAVGALLDIYEQAISSFKEAIADIPDRALTIVVDRETADENCRSIQAILSHVVYAGFGYATSIRNLKEGAIKRPEKALYLDTGAYLQDLDRMFRYTESVFAGLKDEDLEEPDNALKIKTGWGQLYDIEQLMEHAIVHILRHGRQIERLKDIALE